MAGSHKVADLRHRGCQPSVDGCSARQILLVKGDTFTHMYAMRTVYALGNHRRSQSITYSRYLRIVHT